MPIPYPKFRKALVEVVQEMLATTTLTPAEIARRLGLSHGAVHHWTHGQRTPDLRRLMELADVLSFRSCEIVERISKKISK